MAAGQSPRSIASAASSRRGSPRSSAAALVIGSSASGASPTTPETPASSAAFSSSPKYAFTCDSGTAPWKSGNGWPPTTATTVGMDCTRNAAAMRGWASTSTVASTSRPPASATSFSSTGESCLHGSHHVAHRSTTTGTVIDCCSTSVSKLSSVTSTMTPAGAEALLAAAWAAASFAAASAARSTPPRGRND